MMSHSPYMTHPAILTPSLSRLAKPILSVSITSSLYKSYRSQSFMFSLQKLAYGNNKFGLCDFNIAARLSIRKYFTILILKRTVSFSLAQSWLSFDFPKIGTRNLPFSSTTSVLTLYSYTLPLFEPSLYITPFYYNTRQPVRFVRFIPKIGTTIPISPRRHIIRMYNSYAGFQYWVKPVH
jgi:hypothetical protein